MKRLLLLLIFFGVTISAVAGCTGGDKASSAQSQQTGSTGNSSELSGKILFVSAGNVWVWDNGTLKQLTKGGSDTHPVWSPDGTAIAYVNKAASYSDLMLMSAGGGDYKQITNNKPPDPRQGIWAFRPTWTPDGKNLLFLSDSGTDGLALWQIGVDGKNKQRIVALNVNYGGIESPTWSPDGKTIAVTAYQAAVPQIWLYVPSTKKWTQVTKEKQGAYDSRWSPGGSKIAYTYREDGRNDVKVINPDGTKDTEITTDGMSRSPVWSADGKYLAYVSGRNSNGAFDIWAVRVQTLSTGEFTVGEPRQLTKGQNVDPGSGLSWRP